MLQPFLDQFLLFTFVLTLGNVIRDLLSHALAGQFPLFTFMRLTALWIPAMAVYALPMVYFIHSILYGEKAPADPWGAKGLEWEIPSPPPTENFVVTPIVTHGTHQYAPSKEVGIV